MVMDDSQNKNMLSTMRILPIESLIFPSQCSFYQFNWFLFYNIVLIVAMASTPFDFLSNIFW